MVDFDNILQDSALQNGSLVGTDLRDLIQGFNGDDTLYGGLGNDRLEGGNGNDTLVGGAGNDQLLGGVAMTPMCLHRVMGKIPLITAVVAQTALFYKV
ncbi:hypothetical protein [Pseudomonas sp. MWU13-2100]|uniref:hypothetical protein n=1 Tax=Pseudomonas sp. MWU13-2100 TaxID=2935075 RepID=UPI00298CDA06|nr:hypothetical protein [Pseudomonas sp. MWU13-2100]